MFSGIRSGPRVLRWDENVRRRSVGVPYACVATPELAVIASLDPPRVSAEQRLAEGNALGLALLAIDHDVAVVHDDDAEDDVVLVEFSKMGHQAILSKVPEPVKVWMVYMPLVVTVPPVQVNAPVG
jgi:hypothetical protein